MAGGSRGGGDMVLGGRHLVGIFALLVVVLGITFTLGYLLGRSRYEDQARIAAANAPETNADAAPVGARGVPPTPAPGGASSGDTSGRAEAPTASWDFYRSGEPAKTPELEPAPKTVSSAPPKPAVVPAPPVAPTPARVPARSEQPSARTPVPGGSALIPKGAITLQVAALLREGDALALAQALQEKKFPAIVTTPSTDKYYRVQIGPYPDAKSATAARRELEKQGFKPIVRR
jgi:cell division septation protein DedD